MIIPAEKINFDKLSLTKLAPFIQKLIIPLRKYGVILFHHQRLFKDRSVAQVGSNPGIYEDYVRGEFYKQAFCDDIDLYQPCKMFWEEVNCDEWFQLLSQKYNAKNGLLILEKVDEHCDFYGFGFSNDYSSHRSFCLNNMNIFTQFIQYYKKIAESEIEAPMSERIIYHQPQDTSILTNPSLISEAFLTTDTDLLDKFDQVNFCGTCLSSRERQCAMGLYSGLSAKHIGVQLNISHRTVEKHIESIKFKLKCKNQSQLVRMVGEILR